MVLPLSGVQTKLSADAQLRNGGGEVPTPPYSARNRGPYHSDILKTILRSTYGFALGGAEYLGETHPNFKLP